MCMKSHRSLCHPYRSWEFHDSIRYQCPGVTVPKCRRFWRALIYGLSQSLVTSFGIWFNNSTNYINSLISTFYTNIIGRGLGGFILKSIRLARLSIQSLPMVSVWCPPMALQSQSQTLSPSFSLSEALSLQRFWLSPAMSSEQRTYIINL